MGRGRSRKRKKKGSQAWPDLDDHGGGGAGEEPAALFPAGMAVPIHDHRKKGFALSLDDATTVKDIKEDGLVEEDGDVPRRRGLLVREAFHDEGRWAGVVSDVRRPEAGNDGGDAPPRRVCVATTGGLLNFEETTGEQLVPPAETEPPQLLPLKSSISAALTPCNYNDKSAAFPNQRKQATINCPGKMKYHVPLISSVLLLWLSAVCMLAAAEVPPGGCQQERCGNVEIPYPFGITGSKCALDDSFTIDCKVVGGTHKPFTGPFAVIRISATESKAWVKMNFNWQCDDAKAEQRQVSLLQDSQNNHTVFRFSYMDNKIFIIGCDILAIFVGGDMISPRYHDSCMTTCLDAPKNGSCAGVGCCMLDVKKDMVAYDSIYIKQTKELSELHPCNYMVLMEKVGFNFSTSYIFNQTLLNSNSGRVPVVLDWAIRSENGTCEDYTGYDPCKGNNTACVASINGEGYICRCSSGYEGNPYTKDGCTDINECIRNPCGGICQNMPGNFTCTCPRGKEMISGFCMKSLKSSWVITVVICICIGTVIIVIVIACAYFTKERRKIRHIKQRFFRQHGGFLLLEEMKAKHGFSFNIFSELELKQATNNFDSTHIVGHGGQGEVYKGIIRGIEIAVKKCVVVDDCRRSQFGKEIFILAQLNHRNIVKLLGCCLELEIPVLIYELIPNGTLSQLIHSGHPISLCFRIQIAHQVAEALTYLHNWAFPPILHGDVKSDNILMDHNYTVKISDFGSSTLAPSNEAQFMSRVQGTFGYLDPEYMQTGRLTAKSDVYSFGVVILELLTRKKPLNLQRPEDEDTIVGKFMFGTDEQRISYMDDQIKSDSNMMIINDISDLVKQCLDLSGSKRPLMKDVANNLHMLLKRAQGEEASTSSGAQHNLEEEDQFLDQMRRNNSAASQEGGLVSPTPIEEYDIVVSTAGMDAANKKHKKTPATYATLRRTIKAKKGRDGFEPPSAEGPTMRSKKARSATASTPANEMESWHGTLRHPSCRGDGELLLAKSSDHHQQVEGSSSLNNQPVFHG